MKLQSTTQQKQLQYMRPYLCHWAGDLRDEKTPVRNTLDTDAETVQKQIYAGNNATKREAGRRRAAPHIKTYIRFSNAREMDRIDWAMVTSANLSTQAWGAAANANGEVRICSWEIGIIVWPDLFADYPTTSGDCAGEAMVENKRVEMVPCFRQDLPLPHLVAEPDNKPQGTINRGLLGDRKFQPPAAVGFRMPYDLPLSPYSPNDVPWCATARHTEQDWLGQTWDY